MVASARNTNSTRFWFYPPAGPGYAPYWQEPGFVYVSPDYQESNFDSDSSSDDEAESGSSDSETEARGGWEDGRQLMTVRRFLAVYTRRRAACRG